MGKSGSRGSRSNITKSHSKTEGVAPTVSNIPTTHNTTHTTSNPSPMMLDSWVIFLAVMKKKK